MCVVENIDDKIKYIMYRKHKRGNKMKKMLKKIVGFALIFSIVAIAAVPVAFADEKEPGQCSNWMSNIEDDVKLSSISIPGTHDSASNHCTLSYCTSCQDTSMAEQMDNGYRYMDVRLELNSDNNGFVFTHGGFKCRKSFWPWSSKITFDDFCQDLYSFLDANPTETVIVAIKLENSEDDVAIAERLIMEQIAKNQDKWYTQNAIPTLGEARGKAVLATRFDDVLGYGDALTGIHFYWEDQGNEEVAEMPYELSMINSKERLWVQDRYKYTIEAKIDAITDSIENCQAGDETFFINFLSLSGQSLIPHPKGNANTINAAFDLMELKPQTSYGVMVVDYATKEMAKKIYETNF